MDIGVLKACTGILMFTFREDYNTTSDKIPAQNHNIIRKWCLSILKLAELSLSMKRLSIKKETFCNRFASSKIFRVGTEFFKTKKIVYIY